MEGRWRLHAALVLGGGLAVTALITALLFTTASAREGGAFESDVRAAQDAMLDRVETSIALLRATAGLFSSSEDDIPVARFRAYMDRVALPEHYPGILGIGFTRRVAPGEQDALVQRLRAQGHDGFRIWPAQPRDEWHAIVLLEPLDERNRAAIGYDMSTSPQRRAAMERARDTAQAAMSSVVELVQEIDARKQPGFLIYVPVYRGSVLPETAESRRRQLVGFAYAPIRGGDFLSAAFTHELAPRLALAVYMGGVGADTLLYRRGPGTEGSRAAHTMTTSVDVYGQPWTFSYASTTTFAESLFVPGLVALGGIGLSIALALLVWREDKARATIQAALEREFVARGQAEHANRMKDEFLATLSHELRTPLNAIVGWAAVLKLGGLPEAEMRAGLEAVDRNAKAQARLIDDLLDMNRIVSGKLNMKLAALDPADAVDDALAAVLPMAQQKGVRIEKRLIDSGLVVRGDAARLQQIVWNLLSNAIKFTPSGGEVVVSLERSGERARLTVTDSGEGIDPRFVTHVFDRFAQADSTITRHHGGLGLGLAIVRELVALHGGDVRAESAGLGKGATFVVELPLAGPQGTAGAGEALLPADATLEGLDVLVVDDELDVRRLAALVLEQRHARVRCAASASEALEMLAERVPDVIVSDIGMPDMNGYELMRALRAHASPEIARVPAIALTAYARDEDKHEALAAGFDHYLVKPVSPDLLAATVDALVARDQAHEALTGDAAARSHDTLRPREAGESR